MKKLYSTIAMLGAAMASFAQAPFPALEENFYDSTKYSADLNTVKIPKSPLKYNALFVGGVDQVHNASGQTEVARENHDFTGYVPINGRSDSGYVIVNHERAETSSIIGNGGGMTVFIVSKDKKTGDWSVVTPSNGRKFRNVDFSAVGNTAANCGGIQTSWGKVFTAEEWGIFKSNDQISSWDTDTTDWAVGKFNGTTTSRKIPKHMNYQYMVEVDVASAKAVRKNYNMGRYDHEGGWIAADEKSVYLSDDKSSGSVLFKFVANSKRDFSAGQLYAYKQSSDGNSGSWLTIPMVLDSCMHARDVALRMGATVFMRLEWVDGKGDQVYITETGRGKEFDISGALAKGGVAAKHLTQLAGYSGGKAVDMFGRVLRLNTTSNKVEVLLEGGGALDAGGTPTGNHLSSPDGLALTEIDGKTWLAINEDMNPSGMPANPAKMGKMNEIYFLDITGDQAGKTYQVSDLHRFLVGPKGCETTGGRFTPDGMTYFVNIQHPSSTNQAPFNHSTTIAVSGFKDFLASVSNSDFTGESTFKVWPNPVSGYLNLNRVTDVRVVQVSTGQVVRVKRNTNQLDISGLASGAYAVQTIEGEVQRIIVE